MAIKKSMGRYLAILMIIALGAGLFVGLLASKNDIIATGQAFVKEQNMFDLRVLNTYGWTEKEVDLLRQNEGIQNAEGSVVLDVVGYLGAADIESVNYLGTRDMENVFQIHQIPSDVNQVLLLSGRMPESPDECLADGYFATDAVLGAKFVLSDSNDEDTLDSLKYKSYTVVGYVSTPLFMDMTRGNTTLGNGSITSYVYLTEEAFDVDYYTELNLSLDVPGDAYTDIYDDAVDTAEEQYEPFFQQAADQRFADLYAEALEKYNDGLVEYEDAVISLEDGKQEARQKLDDAYQELIDAEKEISDSEKDLISGQESLDDGRKQLKKNKAILAEKWKDFNQAKEDTYAQLDAADAELAEQKQQLIAGLEEVAAALSTINTNLAAVNAGIDEIETTLSSLQEQLPLLKTTKNQLSAQATEIQNNIDTLSTSADPDLALIASLQAQLTQINQMLQEVTAQITALETGISQLEEQLTELTSNQTLLLGSKAQVENTQNELLASQKLLEEAEQTLATQRADADAQFATYEAELTAADKALEKAKKRLDKAETDLEDGRTTLQGAKDDLSDGWDSYYEGKAEADKEIAEAEQKLADAEVELADAKQKIDDLEAPELYILDRNTNIGYLAVKNNSEIVSGVSRVFPVFFLLVAALVCITTMTRMVEEERTQIGTLKALGYSNAAIISKYMLYAGSAAVLGCGLGVVVGSFVFPMIIWEGYKIILELKPQLEIVFDIPLCVIVVLTYTAVMLAVTWYCCRMSLRETPAELIRPKAPTAGKKILLEYLPFWNRIKFLNKVMFRNIFRYKQRLLMMLVGIGGCTALLVTGFGMGDSVMDIVSYQYEEVTKYDIQVQYTDGLTEEQRENILDQMGDCVEDMIFVHESSVELHANNASKNLYLISADETLTEYFDFHTSNKKLSWPENGEALLSIGIAGMMGVQEGDTVTIQNADMEQMELTIAGIYDNHVYNYIIISEQTAFSGWGKELDVQNAFVRVADGVDAHEAGAKLADMDDVLSVMVCQDMADQVNSMLQGLDLIIATIVFCAGLLAVIVIYNLTNINIKERIREISTIKVLGFRAWETAAYVFKENMLLTAMGALIGLGLGNLLLTFVMDQIKIDIVWMPARVMPESYVWSVVVTILMAVLVDFLLFFRLEKINMAESLKSVE